MKRDNSMDDKPITATELKARLAEFNRRSNARLNAVAADAVKHTIDRVLAKLMQ